jgi:hypothetical protein
VHFHLPDTAFSRQRSFQATFPISLLEQACRDAGVPTELTEDGGIGVTDVGETVTIKVRS